MSIDKCHHVQINTTASNKQDGPQQRQLTWSGGAAAAAAAE